MSTIRRSALAVAVLGARGLGGAAVAGAADDAAQRSGSDQERPPRDALSGEVAAGGPYATPYHAHITTSNGTRQVVLVDSSFQATAVQAEDARGTRGRGGPGGHRGGGVGETALTGATKERVEAAVLAEYDGATILRTETNTDSAAPYESHIRTSAGKELEVLVGKDFDVVEARSRPARA